MLFLIVPCLSVFYSPAIEWRFRYFGKFLWVVASKEDLECLGLNFLWLVWFLCVSSQSLHQEQVKIKVMATTCVTALSSLLGRGQTTLLRNQRIIPVSGLAGYRSFLGKKRCGVIVAKAVGDSSDSSSESIVKYIQNVWDNSEDRIALAGLGFAAIAAFWASINLIVAIDKLPLIPNVFEVIGILFSSWFVYRYLLFKPDREELLKNVKNSLLDIIGQ